MLLVILCVILLSACIRLDESTEQLKVLEYQPTAQSTCAVCPTCQPGTSDPSTKTPTTTPTPTRVITFTPTVTSTVIPVTLTPTTSAPSTPTPTITKTATTVPLRFTIQVGMPIYLQNFVHNEKGCNWMGVAGQVFDLNGSPLQNIVVAVKGTLNGLPVSFIALTGYPATLAYGPGGFEVQLAQTVIASSNSLTIQLFDVNGKALSDQVPFTTYASCTTNLILINFSPVTP